MARGHFVWPRFALERALATSRRAGREPLARIHLHSDSTPVGCHGGDQRDNFRVHNASMRARRATAMGNSAADETVGDERAVCRGKHGEGKDERW